MISRAQHKYQRSAAKRRNNKPGIVRAVWPFSESVADVVGRASLLPGRLEFSILGRIIFRQENT